MKIRYNVTSVGIWSLLLMLALFFTGNASLLPCIFIILGVACATLVGSLLIGSINAFTDFLDISFSGASLLLGSLVLSLLVFIPSLSQVQLLAGSLIFTLFLFLLFRKQIEPSFTIGKADVIAFTWSFILMVAVSIQGDMERALSAIPVRLGSEDITDAHFFTAMVTSVRSGTIFSAAYEIGSPINYHTLGFFIPAFWSKLFAISSHQALWGLAMPFYKIITFLLGYELLYYFFKSKVVKGAAWFIIIGMLLPVVLAPLHPLYLIKLNPKNFIFSGMGYILPGGNSPFTFTFPIVLITLILFYNIDWGKGILNYSKVLFAVLLATIVVGKLPLYFVMVIFFGVVILKRLIVDKAKISMYFSATALSLVLAGVLYKIFLTAQGATKLSFKFGYLIQNFGDMMHRPVNTAGQQMFMIVCIAAIFLLWAGIRLAGLWGLYKSGDSGLKEMATGSIGALLASIALTLILHIDHVDRFGHVLREGTFDVLQFVRAGYYLLTVVAGVGIMYLFLNFNTKPYYKRPFVYISAVWFSCALIALIANMKWDRPLKDYDWFNENYAELKTGKYNDGLITVNPFQKFHGVMLSGSDLGTYWTAMAQSNGCYNLTLKNSYRWDLFNDVLQKQDDHSLAALKKEGVKYIFSTPEDSNVFSNISQKYPGNLQKAAGTKWVYIIN
ncbi:MAG: hypothetical protein P4L41_13535 [Flavipsychrobacter sp.]|nr:hypothetical protein [Flavipsychrobacter sp.]